MENKKELRNKKFKSKQKSLIDERIEEANKKRKEKLESKFNKNRRPIRKYKFYFESFLKRKIYFRPKQILTKIHNKIKILKQVLEKMNLN